MEQVAQALAAVESLLDSGPDAVTVSAVADVVGLSAAWVYRYVGPRDVLLRRAVRVCVDRARAGLLVARRHDPLVGLRATGAIVEDVLGALLPSSRTGPASLWILRLAEDYCWARGGHLSRDIAAALGPVMPQASTYRAIGEGILGVLLGMLPFRPSREDAMRVIRDMTLSVALYERALAGRVHKSSEPPDDGAAC